MAGHGGRREGAGRKPGVPNKAAGVIKEAAQVWGMAGLTRLALLAGLVPGKPGAESEQTQVAAIRELLDRGYGKAAQSVTADVTLHRSLVEMTDDELLAMVAPDRVQDFDEDAITTH
jgi:hypothetical protein